MLTRWEIDSILESSGFDLEEYRAHKVMYSDYPELTPLNNTDAQTNIIFYKPLSIPLYDCGWDKNNAYRFIEQYKSTIKPERKITGYPAHNARISKMNKIFYLSQGIISKNQTLEEKIIALFNYRTKIGHFIDTEIFLEKSEDGLYSITYICTKSKKRLSSFTYPLTKIYQDLLFYKWN